MYFLIIDYAIKEVENTDYEILFGVTNMPLYKCNTENIVVSQKSLHISFVLNIWNSN